MKPDEFDSLMMVYGTAAFAVGLLVVCVGVWWLFGFFVRAFG
jgi:hypothetical protein